MVVLTPIKRETLQFFFTYFTDAQCVQTKVKVDGRREGGPEKDGCHKLEDTCAQKRRLEDGREGGQGPTRTVEPRSRVVIPAHRSTALTNYISQHKSVLLQCCDI